MGNSVAEAKAYLQMLDEAYKAGAKSSILDVNPAFVRESDMAGTFYIPKISLVGLGDYSTSAGFPDGDVTLEWVAYTYAEDRGRQFGVDNVENAEAAMMAFGNLTGQFLKLHEIPEIDAYRFAKIATDAGTDATGTLDTAAKVCTALNTALDKLDENEVPEEDRILFINPALKRLVETDAKTNATTDAFTRATVVTVPKGRFYTTCTTNAGATSDAGGFANAGKEINFILMDKGAAFADAKHQSLRTFSPNGEEGFPMWQEGDMWIQQFRIKHDCWIYSNRTNGVYVHTK